MVVLIALMMALTRLVKSYPGSFVTVSHVNTVLGNFKHFNSSNPPKQLYNSGRK